MYPTHNLHGSQNPWQSLSKMSSRGQHVDVHTAPCWQCHCRSNYSKMSLRGRCVDVHTAPHWQCHHRRDYSKMSLKGVACGCHTAPHQQHCHIKDHPKWVQRRQHVDFTLPCLDNILPHCWYRHNRGSNSECTALCWGAVRCGHSEGSSRDFATSCCPTPPHPQTPLHSLLFADMALLLLLLRLWCCHCHCGKDVTGELGHLHPSMKGGALMGLVT